MIEAKVEVDKSISGAYWRMRYKGKVAFEEDEPTEATKAKFKKSIDNGSGVGLAPYDRGELRSTVKQAER